MQPNRMTVHEMAIALGASPGLDGLLDDTEYGKLGIPPGGQCRCGNVIRGDEAYVGTDGMLYCRNCIGEDGFTSILEYLTYNTRMMLPAIELADRRFRARIAKLRRRN